MTLPRLLPDSTTLVLSILRPALAGVRVSSQWEGAYLSSLPYVWVDVSEAAEKHPEFAGNAYIEAHCFAKSAEAARDVAEAVRVTLYRATRDQTVTAAGHLSRYQKTSRTELVPADVHGVYRTFTTYTLGTRPPQP